LVLPCIWKLNAVLIKKLTLYLLGTVFQMPWMWLLRHKVAKAH